MTLESKLESLLASRGPTPLPVVRSWVQYLPSYPEPFHIDAVNHFIIKAFPVAEMKLTDHGEILQNPALARIATEDAKRGGESLASYTEKVHGRGVRLDLSPICSNNVFYASETLLVLPK